MDEEPEKKAPRMVVEEVTAPATEAVVKPVAEPAVEIKTKNPPEVKTEEIPAAPEKQSFNILWIIIPGFLILGVLIGGIFAYYSGLKKINTAAPAETQEPSITPASSPTASPSAQIDLTKYPITILNGSGIKGEAGKVQTILEKAGFKVALAGNAKTYDFIKTEISIKKDVEAGVLETLVKTLEVTYQLAEAKTVSTQSASIVVTVGSLKAQ